MFRNIIFAAIIGSVFGQLGGHFGGQFNNGQYNGGQIPGLNSLSGHNSAFGLNSGLNTGFNSGQHSGLNFAGPSQSSGNPFNQQFSTQFPGASFNFNSGQFSPPAQTHQPQVQPQQYQNNFQQFSHPFQQQTANPFSGHTQAQPQAAQPSAASSGPLFSFNSQISHATGHGAPNPATPQVPNTLGSSATSPSLLAPYSGAGVVPQTPVIPQSSPVFQNYIRQTPTNQYASSQPQFGLSQQLTPSVGSQSNVPLASSYQFPQNLVPQNYNAEPFSSSFGDFQKYAAQAAAQAPAPPQYSPPAQQYSPPAQQYSPPVQQYSPPPQPQYAPQPAPQQSFGPSQQSSAPNPLHAQAAVHYASIGGDLKGDYKFGYQTGDKGSFREESRLPDGTVEGQYGYVDPNGEQRIVKYSAGKEGFKILGDKEAPASAPAQQQAPQQQYSAPQQQYSAPPQPQQYAAPPAQSGLNFNTNPAYSSFLGKPQQQ